MEISAEKQEREITIFTNGKIPEVQVTTRREEAKENVNENLAPVIVVSENMEAVKGAAKYAQTFDDVLLNLPSIIKAIPAAETAVQAKDDAISAKESAQESAETAQSAAVRAEETLSKMSRVMEYKGNVATFADLPTTAKIGDVWNVLDTGANYAWDGTTWDKFGELVDLSGYYTKEEAQTALAEKQDILEPGKGVKIEGNVISVEGGDGNAYTKENLIGGKGVEIVPEATGGGKDEHTLALWHFDGTLEDELNKLEFYSSSDKNPGFVEGKFGQALKSVRGGASGSVVASDLLFKDIDFKDIDFTIDFWFKHFSSGGSSVSTGRNSSAAAYNGFSIDFNTSYNVVRIKVNDVIKASVSYTKSSEYEHRACQKKGDTLTAYVNGEAVLSYTLTESDKALCKYKGIYINTATYTDELRVSDIARYDGKFTPPTEPYAEPVYTGRSTIEAEGKADTDLGNIPANYDYVVESKYPTEDSPSWYRVYKSGWVEQGGRVSSSTENTALTITLLKPMKNNRYCIQRTSASTSTTAATFRSFGVTGITTTTFNMYITDTLSPTYWYVCGQGA